MTRAAAPADATRTTRRFRMEAGPPDPPAWDQFVDWARTPAPGWGGAARGAFGALPLIKSSEAGPLAAEGLGLAFGIPDAYDAAGRTMDALPPAIGALPHEIMQHPAYYAGGAALAAIPAALPGPLRSALVHPLLNHMPPEAALYLKAVLGSGRPITMEGPIQRKLAREMEESPMYVGPTNWGARPHPFSELRPDFQPPAHAMERLEMGTGLEPNNILAKFDANPVLGKFGARVARDPGPPAEELIVGPGGIGGSGPSGHPYVVEPFDRYEFFLKFGGHDADAMAASLGRDPKHLHALMDPADSPAWVAESHKMMLERARKLPLIDRVNPFKNEDLRNRLEGFATKHQRPFDVRVKPFRPGKKMQQRLNEMEYQGTIRNVPKPTDPNAPIPLREEDMLDPY